MRCGKWGLAAPRTQICVRTHTQGEIWRAEDSMARGIGRDLYGRLDAAFEKGECLTPVSRNDAARLRRARRAGAVESPWPGMYARPESWTGLTRRVQEEFVIRTLARCHPTWTFAGVSAAVMHGLDVSYSHMDRIHLATPRSAHTRDCGLVARHTMSSVPATMAGGVRVTSLSRTVFDCLRSLDFRSGLAIADSAVRITGLPPARFIDEFGKLHRRHSGHRRAVEIMSLADGRAENGGESVARAVMIEQGIMLPDLQVEVADPVNPARRLRVDFRWRLPLGDVYGELDGREKYVDPTMTGGRDVLSVLADERLRESHLSGSAKVLRFSYWEVTDPALFCPLTEAFGIPSGYAVPAVADPRDPINQTFGAWRTKASRASAAHLHTM